MASVRIIEIKESVFADNDREADRVRAKLKEEKTFLLNLMSSPGSGKTTTLLRTIERLKDDLRIGVMEADIDSSVDAETIARAGVKSIQLHTGGMCHLDAGMTEQGLTELGTAGMVSILSSAPFKTSVCATAQFQQDVSSCGTTPDTSPSSSVTEETLVRTFSSAMRSTVFIMWNTIPSSCMLSPFCP